MFQKVFSVTALGLLCVCAGLLPASAQEKTDTEKTDQGKTDTQLPKAVPPAGTAATAKVVKDRWLVKTASDLDAKRINTRAQRTTIEKLLALPRPTEMPLDGSNPAFQEKRAAPVELTVYSVEADVVECRLMRDGDYRVTLQGASGKTLILEMPDPAPAFVSPDSPFVYSIKAAREQFNARVKPETTPTPVHLHARITGIGYFARAYGKQKPEGNLVQLHPVLNIDWMPQPSKEFADAAQNAQSKDTPKPLKP